MPDILCHCGSRDILEEIAELCVAHDVRVKSTLDISTALEWAKIWNFDAVIVDGFVISEDRIKLSLAVWEREPGTIAYLYDPLGHVGDRNTDVVLEGFIPITKGQARSRLEKIIQSLRAHEEKKSLPFRILVVEDLDSPRDIICSYIEAFGVGQVEGVRSAKEALSMLQQDPEKYSCVITDMRMPEVTGQQLIEQIRINPKLQQIPIIVLTAYGTADCLVDCLKAGASGFLVKPPKKKDLLRELSRAIRINQNNDSPRLTSKEEAELLREMLFSK